MRLSGSNTFDLTPYFTKRCSDLLGDVMTAFALVALLYLGAAGMLLK